MDKIKFLDLGKQPIANGFLTEDEFDDELRYDLSVGVDEDTYLVTHMDYIDPGLIFNDKYAYRGSMSRTMRSHFAEFSYSLRHYLPDNPQILEIGSNDGVFLSNWHQTNTFAVEPCGNFAKETNNLGYKTYNEFWNQGLSEQIAKEQGCMDLVFAANCICHIPDLDSTFKAVHNILSQDGLFIFEDPSLAAMININSYDQIYDEHPHIFSVTALNSILRRNGLSIVRVDNINSHGGSNRIWATKLSTVVPDASVRANMEFESIIGLDSLDTFVKFTSRVHQSKADLVELLQRCKAHNKKVISYGATSKSTTIFNYCGIGTDLIQYITDTTPEKQNKFSPGAHIPIISPDMGFDNTVDFAFLGAWNFADEIKDKEKDFKGRFITHVPIVRIL